MSSPNCINKLKLKIIRDYERTSTAKKRKIHLEKIVSGQIFFIEDQTDIQNINCNLFQAMIKAEKLH